MWPFRRRDRSKEREGEASWSVAQGDYDGAPLFARIRSDPGPRFRQSHVHRVGVAVPLRAPDARGLPQPEEFARLAEIEDILSAAFESNSKSIHVLSITTSGMREFVFYACDPGWVELTLSSIQGQVPDHELQLAIEHDPEWSVYGQFSQ